MTTIKEVADHAGVSVATVSRVVNKTGYVSLHLQNRVTEAMEALNYRPSALARSLRRQRTQTIGVLIPQLDQPFFGTLSFAIEKFLFTQNYHALICSAEENAEKEDAYIDILLRQRVEGVILVPVGRSVTNVGRLLKQDVPVVLVDRNLPNLPLSRVSSNNYQGGYIAMHHLLELGHRRLAVICGPRYSEPMMQRLEGARQALSDFGVDPIAEVVLSTTLQEFELSYNAARTLLQPPSRPSAVFALNDVMAVGVLHAAADLGLKVPDTLSVVGFDNIPLASYVVPTLTTIAQPITAIGETAARMLFRRIEDDTTPVETVLLDTELMVRYTTRPLASG